jgi:hypothetical protein
MYVADTRVTVILGPGEGARTWLDVTLARQIENIGPAL